MSKVFRLKQFNIAHDICAMKVGTDSMLLGSWITSTDPRSCLDIGAGCGILSMMMAQRFDTLESVDAVEIDKYSARQGNENFRKSRWSSIIQMYATRIQDFRHLSKKKYDLIVSNPPFFEDGLISKGKSRGEARHTKQLSFSELLGCASAMMNSKGSFSLILPFSHLGRILSIASGFDIYPKVIMRVSSKANHYPLRATINFSFEECLVENESLYLREENGMHSKDFKKLTEDFYLGI